MQRAQRTAMKRILELGQARLRLSKPFKTSKKLIYLSSRSDILKSRVPPQLEYGHHFERTI